MAIKDNANYVPLLTDPRVTNRESVNFLHTVAYWQAANGLQNQRLDTDTDRDGVANVLEAALGSDPLAATTLSTPTQSFINISGQTFSAITFTSNPAIDDLTLTVEWSNDLLNWSTTMTTEVSRVPTGGLETITVRSIIPAGNGSQFLRVRVDQP